MAFSKYIVHIQENRIGQDFALYYLAYATYLELRGSFATADGIYQEGLSRSASDMRCLTQDQPQVLLLNAWYCCRLAHPIDRLRTKYDDFQSRMVRLAFCILVLQQMSS